MEPKMPEAPSRPRYPGAKQQLQDNAKRYRKIAADLEDLADALGSRPLNDDQAELLGQIVGSGVPALVESKPKFILG